MLSYLHFSPAGFKALPNHSWHCCFHFHTGRGKLSTGDWKGCHPKDAARSLLLSMIHTLSSFWPGRGDLSQGRVVGSNSPWQWKKHSSNHPKHSPRQWNVHVCQSIIEMPFQSIFSMWDLLQECGWRGSPDSRGHLQGTALSVKLKKSLGKSKIL